MRSFGDELYLTYKYEQKPEAEWMKAERYEYCEKPAPKQGKALHVLTQLLFSIFA